MKSAVFRNILLSALAISALVASATYTYTTIDGYLAQRRFFDGRAQAKKECAKQGYNEWLTWCLASKGF